MASKAGFIANGDIVEIQKIISYEELYGRRFANVVCKLMDYPSEAELETKILLDVISVDSANLPKNEMKVFFNEVE